MTRAKLLIAFGMWLCTLIAISWYIIPSPEWSLFYLCWGGVVLLTSIVMARPTARELT